MAHFDAGAKLVMVTGAYPPDVCGVGDYTERLMTAAPPCWEVFVARDWSLGAAPEIVRKVFDLRPSNLVIQYPTQGYGWSLVPQLLVVIGRVTGRYRGVLALHEFSSLSRKAQLTLALASHFAAHIVFTTGAERDHALSHPFFSSQVPTSIIGILSNIPVSEPSPAFSSRKIDLAYFGHIRPNKGLEDFLDVMEAIRDAGGAQRLAVIGEVPPGYENFGETVISRCRAIECELMLGLDDQAVAQQLANVRILYLPFRDGVSARRGSVLAGLGNGALVATRIGKATPLSLQPAIIACAGGAADVDVLLDALRWTNRQVAERQEKGKSYIETMLPRDWAHIAALYDRAVSGKEAIAEPGMCL